MVSESMPEGFFPPMDAMQLHKQAFNILINRNKRLNSEISQLNNKIAELEAVNKKLRKNISYGGLTYLFWVLCTK